MRSLKNKIRELKQSVCTSSLQCDIIALTETWLDEHYQDSEIKLPGYKTVRCDRDFQKTGKCRAGGLLLYIRDSIKCRVINKSQSGIEYLSVLLNIHGQKVMFTLTYAPPYEHRRNEIYLNDFKFFVSEMEKIINTLEDDTCSIVCGDFNLPGYTWQVVNDISLAKGFHAVWQVREAVTIIENFVNRSQYKQSINVLNNSGNCLDLLFSDIYDITTSISRDPLVTVFDQAHPYPVIATACIKKINPLQYCEITFNYNNMNFDKINESLESLNWIDIMHGLSTVDEMVDIFYDILYSTIEKNVPKKTKRNSSYPPWFDHELIQAVDKKKELHCKLKESYSALKEKHFKDQRKICKRMTSIKHSQYLNKIGKEIKEDPKKFWNFVDIKNVKNRNFPDSVYLNNSIATTGEDMVNLFADHFKDIYNPPNPTVPDSEDSTPYDSFNHTPLQIINITELEIRKTLESLSDKLGMGPDKIPVKFIKAFSEHLIKPLFIIFNHSNFTGVFPTKWKTSFVTPVPKKGDKENVINYRSIVKTSIFGKMLESMNEARMPHFLKKHINKNQHGFMPKRSTTSNLAVYSNYINKNLKNKKQIDAIYTDMRAAFDKVDHEILINKFKKLGIVGSALKWIESFLIGRKLIVKIKNYVSYEYEPTFCVPQGSHCGPLLFIIMINDLANKIKYSEISLFADDFKVYKVINNLNDHIQLQWDLQQILSWAKENSLEFNYLKFAIITFSKSNCVKFSYSLDGNELARVESIKDLGIYFDTYFTFEEHIEYVTNKAFKKIGFIQRYSKNFKDPSIYLTLYKTLIKPTLTYASEIWSPLTKTLSYKIEKTQNRFLRSYSFRVGQPMAFNNHNYTDILKLANLPTLESVREYQDILFLYKVNNFLIDAPDLLGLLNWHVPGRSLRHNYTTFKVETGNNEFMHRGIINRASAKVNEKLSNIDFNFTRISEFKRVLKDKVFCYQTR